MIYGNIGPMWQIPWATVDQEENQGIFNFLIATKAATKHKYDVAIGLDYPRILKHIWAK